MTAVFSSIDCDPFQLSLGNRFRAVGVQIPKICPRRAPRRPEGAAGRP